MIRKLCFPILFLALAVSVPARGPGYADEPVSEAAAEPGEATTAAPAPEPPAYELVEVAESSRQWTGIAVSPTGRVFVNFPRWSAEVPVSVGELLPDGSVLPYPDEARNGWSPGDDPALGFVCVQSVHVDAAGRLWVLDPASPLLAGVVEGGPKLLEVDLETDRVVRSYAFDAAIAPARSYLNDVRVDPGTRTAYMTDSGLGALVVLDLDTGAARRVLAGHPSTRAEKITVTVGGAPFPFPVHSDGIALDREGGWLYYQALTGRTLYRVPTEALRNPDLDPAELAAAVERFAESGVSDGLLFGPGGIYVSALEEDAVKLVNARGEVSTVVRDPRIVWPDSFALGPDGSVWFATSQIHRGPNPATPYRVLRLKPLSR